MNITDLAVLLKGFFCTILQAEFLSSKTDIGVYDVFSSPSQTYLQVKTKSQDIKVQSLDKTCHDKNQVTRGFSILIHVNHVLFLGWKVF